MNWQNRVYKDTTTPYGTSRTGHALVDLFTRHQVTKIFRTGNINNPSDKTHDNQY
ncbi:hypothetical protein KCP77_16700 [Salmonella enterica subsp. enterica]|nr:hypothetical protein KCP77_16700 [Salmonella enterica subsp. enterica]